MTSNNAGGDSKAPRGDFNLLGMKKDKKPKAKVYMVICCGVIFLLIALCAIFFFAYRAMEANSTEKVDESKVKADPALSSKVSDDDELQKRRKQILDNRKQEEKKQQLPPAAAATAALPAKPEPPPPSAAYLRKLGGGVLVQESDKGSGSGSQQGVAPAEQPEPTPAVNTVDVDSGTAMAGGGDNTRGSLSDLGGTHYAATSAYMSPPRKLLLKRKSNLRCALYTGVKTDHPGFVKCILIQPLYSSDGSVILAEKGAELDGEQKVEMKAGQSSVFTTWTDMETAGGVRASLNGLGTGAMGESGTDAYMDNHYGQKFGGAVMLSFIQDAFASAANATKQTSSTYSFDNSESNAENMATKALDSSINIKPTGYVLPGTVINVIVAQDIDFSTVFKTRRQH